VFTGPKGDIISFQSVAGNWVVFEEYNDSYDGGPWAMMALNTVTRRVIALDSREREGVPSLSPIPHTDGKRVVWQSWTTNNGTITSVVRTYDLQSGKRQMVAEGGTIKGWSYFGASISGDRVIFSKQYPATELAQVMLANLKTGRVTALTPASKATSSPWISGDLAVWRVGWNFSITKTIVVRTLRTGGQRTIPADNAQLPEIMLGRYVVFSTGYSAKDERIHVYDAQTHKGRVLVGPGTWSQGRYPGGFFAVGGHALSYQLGHKYNPATPEKIVVTMLR